MGLCTKTRDSPSGLTQTWKLWRHCCCRYGLYPVLLAPFVTAALCFELYSFFGCQFLQVDVGFTPSNPAWNQSTAYLGLFFYQSPYDEPPHDNILRETFTESCRAYSDAFEEQFINNDRTWQVARIMAYISASAAIVATVTIWLFVSTPIPSCFFWPGVMIPSVMVAFLSSGSKFLFFDTAICHSALWFPSGADSLPRTAESCNLAKTSYFAIAAGALFFVILVVTCFKAPVLRELKQDFGEPYAKAMGSDASYDHEEFATNADLEGSMMDQDAGQQMSFAASSAVMTMTMDDSMVDEEEGEAIYFDQNHNTDDDVPEKQIVRSVDSFDGIVEVDYDGRDDSVESDSSTLVDEREDDSAGSIYIDPKTPSKPSSGPEVEKSHRRVVSQERLAKMEQLQQAAASPATHELIDKCVADLEKSFM